MLTAIMLGFGVGLRHAFDPDHVVAVSAIAVHHRNPWTVSWIGVSWGIGHSLMLLAAGFAVIALRVAIPETLLTSAEVGIGVILVVIGATNLLALSARFKPDDHSPPSRLGSVMARSGVVGLAHGLAGSGTVTLLALAAMPTTEMAMAYVASFAVGTIGGMVGFSLLLGTPAAAFRDRSLVRRFAIAGTGTISIALGIALIFEFALDRTNPLTG
ncbi:MAG TPA: hypothetical protein VGB31_05325 [Myxococcota bacterium]